MTYTTTLPEPNDSLETRLGKLLQAWQSGTGSMKVASLGIGGPVTTAAPLEIVANSVAVAESASLSSTRLIELTGAVASTGHKVIDAGFHCDLNGFNFTGDLAGTYGGWFVEDSVGGGTASDARGLSAYGNVGAGAVVSYGYGVRSSLNVAATATLSNGFGYSALVSTMAGTLTNYDGFHAGDATAGTRTCGFRSQIASGSGKWGLYLDSANNYLGTGTTLLGATAAPGTGRLQFVTGTTAADGIGFGSDVTLYRSAANVLKSDDTLDLAGDLQFATGSEIKWSTRTRVRSGSDGVLTMANAANTDFTALNFGGTTSSFPAWRKASTGLDAKLADNSEYAAVQSLYHRFGSGSPEGVVTAPVGCLYSRTNGGAGTSLYVKESGSGNTGWVAK